LIWWGVSCIRLSHSADLHYLETSHNFEKVWAWPEKIRYGTHTYLFGIV